MYSWALLQSQLLKCKSTASLSFQKILDLEWTLIVHCSKFGSRYPGKAQQLQEQCYPLLSVCAAFLHVQTMVCLPVLGIFNVYTGVDACDCTWGLYGHSKSLHWKLTGGKNPLLQQGPESTSVLHLGFQLDTLPTELSLPHVSDLNQKCHNKLKHTVELCFCVDHVCNWLSQCVNHFCCSLKND